MILSELDKIKHAIFPWITVFTALFTFFFIFSIQRVEIFGAVLFVPIPSTGSIAFQFLGFLHRMLLPEGIELLITNPLNAFFIQIQISLFLAFLISLPFLLYRVMSYLSPALYRHEKRTLAKAILPSAVLFLTGCVFAFFVLIPFTLKLMTSYTSALDAAVFFEISEFISFVLIAMFATGTSFMLPIFMKVLSDLGIANAGFWSRNFRYAFIVILIVAALITPDGTGVTMIILSLPLMALYLLGIFMSRKRGSKA